MVDQNSLEPIAAAFSNKSDLNILNKAVRDLLNSLNSTLILISVTIFLVFCLIATQIVVFIFNFKAKTSSIPAKVVVKDMKEQKGCSCRNSCSKRMSPSSEKSSKLTSSSRRSSMTTGIYPCKTATVYVDIDGRGKALSSREGTLQAVRNQLPSRMKTKSSSLELESGSVDRSLGPDTTQLGSSSTIPVYTPSVVQTNVTQPTFTVGTAVTPSVSTGILRELPTPNDSQRLVSHPSEGKMLKAAGSPNSNLLQQ